MIIWLMGISGAGKTTIGLKLQEFFNQKQKKNYLVDGDEIRNLFENDLGYSTEDRKANVKRIIMGAYILDRNDIIGIICNISPFEELRELARKKIEGYNEIYLKKDLKVSIEKDVKNVYQQNLGKTEIVGVNIGFDEPKHSDLILEVDKMTEEETFKRVVQYIEERYGI
ncbi:adenylyl-sulfate kinase [Anaerosacchariphilus polymeriproducens]|uniref:Adenylyl-sulfate kinase n=1 Tax=Anaerosacchariphilus polymeriproducens TaxID=1812858 RepID=A0A371ATB0_9FIRM|nr:adenylyl-sulfate kinase [Anaerosacchariphilus polymeriproducens]RDU22798.1 adenylyl-sulfate kinase [Anaerosacchariphilus polymeriproducens]